MRHPDYYTGRLGNRLFQMAYLYTQVRDGIIPDWYVQDIKYFGKYAEEIKLLFNEGITPKEGVGLHYRVGGNPLNSEEPPYKDNPFYVNLGETDYYERALDYFPNQKVVIFSDNTEEAKRRFPYLEVREGQNELEDFNELAGMEHQIIANSSYSYWAAFLNPNPNKKVIYPKNWYTDGVKRTRCPQDWIEM